MNFLQRIRQMFFDRLPSSHQVRRRASFRLELPSPRIFQASIGHDPAAVAAVYYYEPRPFPVLQAALLRLLPEIKKHVEWKELRFVHLGAFAHIQPSDAAEWFSRFFPVWHPTLPQDRLAGLDFAMLSEQYGLITRYLGLPECREPCFIAPVRERSGPVTRFIVIPFPDSVDPDEVILLRMLSAVPDVPQEKEWSAISQSIRINPDFLDRQTGDIEPSPEILAEAARLMAKYRGSDSLDLVLTMLNSLKASGAVSDPRLLDLIGALGAAPRQTLSRLRVLRNGDLHLIDYQQTISLTALQKTVYVFFLRHPDGILFKDLSRYREELKSIYVRYSTRKDPEAIDASIDDLVNPFSNSMSEKCSFIKGAFLRRFSDPIASQYYVQGDRYCAKKILLDRSLVMFEEGEGMMGG